MKALTYDGRRPVGAGGGVSGVLCLLKDVPRGAFPKNLYFTKNFVFAHQNRLNKFLKRFLLFIWLFFSRI
jgi:hypothetical protein